MLLCVCELFSHSNGDCTQISGRKVNPWRHDAILSTGAMKFCPNEFDERVIFVRSLGAPNDMWLNSLSGLIWAIFCFLALLISYLETKRQPCIKINCLSARYQVKWVKSIVNSLHFPYSTHLLLGKIPINHFVPFEKWKMDSSSIYRTIIISNFKINHFDGTGATRARRHNDNYNNVKEEQQKKKMGKIEMEWSLANFIVYFYSHFFFVFGILWFI